MKKLRKTKSEKSWYKVESKRGIYYTNTINYKSHRFIVKKDGKPNPLHLLEAIEQLEKEHDEKFSTVYGVDGVYSVDVKKQESKVELPSGTYNFLKEDYVSGLPERLVPVDFRDDKYIELPNSISENISNDIKEFINNEEIYRKLNIIYKIGLMLYGPPGEGKTSLIRNIVRSELPKESVVITIKDEIPSTSFLQTISETLKDRLKIFIIEEFTQFLHEQHSVEEILTFLDGENSIDKSICISTTNYPELLPGNIVERPSRFDKLYKLNSPEEESRKLLLTYYLMRDCTKEEIKITDKLSSAAIKELCLMSHIKKMSVEKCQDIIRKQIEIARKQFKTGGKIGF